MNKVSFGLILVFFSVFFSSCEQVIENPTLPFEERIVVYGILVPNQQIRIFVSKTIPPLSNEPIFPLLQDAIVQIESDGQSFTLDTENAPNPWDGSFFTTNLLQIQEGKRYNLRVQWNGKTVTSSTFIPSKPSLSSRWYSDTVLGTNIFQQTFLTNFSAKNLQNTTIMGIDLYVDTVKSILDFLNFDEQFNFLEYSSNKDTTTVSLVRGLDDFPEGNRYVRLLSIDQAFLLYYNTVDRRNNGDGIFSGGGGNPVWNVYGDGFGLFLGVNPGYAINVNK